MDRIPVELISIIIGHLLQRNISKEPFSHLTGDVEKKLDDWQINTRSSRNDVCMARLVCRKFYSSSFSTFGDVLGDRVFRFTRAGLEEMQAISDMASLRPHIRRITMGTAQFDDISDNVVLEEVLDAMSESDKTRLQFAYTDAYEWQQTHQGLQGSQEVARILQVLPHLHCLCILMTDYPDIGHHLGGWLGPGDEAIVAKAFSESVSSLFVNEYIYKLAYADISPLDPFLDALKSTTTTITDLRLGCGHGPPPNDFSRMLRRTNMTSTLRHLRLNIDPGFCRERESFYCGSLFETFEELTSLTHLTLEMAMFAGLESYSVATQNLLSVLAPLQLLQNLVIQGPWWFSEDNLVDFVSRHNKNLSLLALKGPVMNIGEWNSAIPRLLQLRPGTLQYLEVSNMSMLGPNDMIIQDFNDDFDWAGFVDSVRKPIEGQTMCSVYLSSAIRTGKYIFEPSVH